MKKNKKNAVSKKMSKSKKVAIAGGVAALSVASVGAYYLLGPNAKAHQKKASVLMAKMKREVESKIKQAKEVSTPLYHKAVDVVSENYAKQYKMHEGDIKALAKKLKSEWRSVVNKGVKKSVSKKKRV